MAASELNNRLDYLISYSSQLVFVCSDKIQQQSQVVESFIAQQNEQADLAVLTANELTPLVIYREKLFRQLISATQAADFNRPLNQLLAPLNNHSGSILINIFQAEKLPDKLVKELWDLVLQSRFANNKQHLNVLLMGLSDWAQSAKAGLRAKSKGQPIVLSSHTDIQHTEADDFSDLESFIQDKRKKFAQRVEERHHQTYEATPIYKKWWVAILLGLIFLSIFTGMLSWQYPQKVGVLIAYIDTQISPQNPPLEQTVTPELTEPVLTKNLQPEPLEIKEIAAATNKPIAKKVSTKDALVTDWRTASAKLDRPTNKVLLQSSNNTNEPIELKPKQSIDAEQSIPTKGREVQTDIVNDKVEVEPMAKQEELQFASLAQEVPTDGFLQPTLDVLVALPDDNFVIQIAAMASMNTLQSYINEEQLGEQLWLYKTQRYGGDWYVLLNNQHFSSIEGARAEIINLQDGMLRNTPFVKSIAQIKQEITVSGD